MNKIIENLLLPKPQFNVGQVWGDINTTYQFIITDVTFVNYGVVRAIVLGEDNFGDKFDVLLKKENYPDILTRDRCTMRITEGPIPTKILTQYHFSLQEKDTALVLESLKIEKYEFEPMQELVNAKYLNKLDNYHLLALNVLEEEIENQEEISEVEDNKKTIIIYLPNPKKQNKHYKLALAAASDDHTKELFDFWTTEYKMYLDNKSISILENENFIVRFTIIENGLYLVFYNSSDVKLIEDICLTNKSTQTSIFAEDRNLKVVDRSFTSFNLSNIKPGSYILSFNENGEKKQFEVLIHE